MAAVDPERVAKATRALLEALGEDASSELLRRTPERVSQLWGELLHTDDAETILREGIIATPSLERAAHVHGATGRDDVDDGHDAGSRFGEVIIIDNIRFRSVCPHHLLPYAGIAAVAYIPTTNIVGLSRMHKAVGALAARLTVQEQLVADIADLVERALDAQGVLVSIRASHGCVGLRDLAQLDSTTVTIVARGVLDDASRRAEIVPLLAARGHSLEGGAERIWASA